jgi:hypothetical protein
MRIYIGWGEQPGYEPVIHSVDDGGVLRFRMKQREGEAALATLTMKAEQYKKFAKAWCFISFQDRELHHIFSGQKGGVPRKKKFDLVEIDYVALWPNAFEQLGALRDRLKEEATFEPLLFQGDNVVDVLEGRNELFYWNRTSGQVSLSDLFHGKSSIDITPFALEHSLKQHIRNRPLERIKVTLEAAWVQDAHGEFDIAPLIARKFSGGIINTLSPKGLIQSWPKIGDHLGTEKQTLGTGFQVVESMLKPLNLAGAFHAQLPTLTQEIVAEENGKPKAIQLKRFWFKSHLAVGWQYRQKRREFSHIRLEQDCAMGQKVGNVRRLHLKLGKLSKGECFLKSYGSFFTTTRGHKVIAAAHEIAKAHLAASARCFEIQVDIPFKELWRIDLDTTVKLCHESLPAGWIEGKVIGFEARASFEDTRLVLKIATSLGTGVIKHKEAPEASHLDNLVSTSHGQVWTTPSGMKFLSCHGQIPAEGILDPTRFYRGDFVRSLDIDGCGEKQELALANAPYPSGQNWQELLAQQGTKINLQFMNLETKPCLEHHIHIDTLSRFSGPRQTPEGGLYGF